MSLKHILKSCSIEKDKFKEKNDIGKRNWI